MLALGAHLGDDALLGLLGRHARDLHELALLFVDAGLDVGLVFSQLAVPAGKLLLLGQKLLLLGRGLLDALLEARARILQLALLELELAVAVAELRLLLALLVEKIVLALQDDFLFLRLGFLAGLEHDALGQPFGIAKALGHHGLAD